MKVLKARPLKESNDLEKLYSGVENYVYGELESLVNPILNSNNFFLNPSDIAENVPGYNPEFCGTDDDFYDPSGENTSALETDISDLIRDLADKISRVMMYNFDPKTGSVRSYEDDDDYYDPRG